VSAPLAFVDRLKRHVVGDSLVRRNPFYYERSHRIVDRLEHQDFEARRRSHRERLARTLAAAQRTEYGKLVGGTDDLATWPLLDKELLRNRLDAFTTRRDWFAAPANTGGTAGVPLKLVRSLDGIVFEQACVDRMVRGLGLDPRAARSAILRGDNLQDPRTLLSPDGVRANGGRARIFCAHSVSSENAARLIEALERFAPQLVCAYPSALEALCQFLVEQGRQLSVPAVLVSSEVFKPEAWELAREALGCRIADYYGQSERVAFAYAFEPREYRFLPGYSYVEFVPHAPALMPDGLLPEGSTDRLYEIVGTTFWNSLMPLVRYRTGDLVRLPAAWGASELEELSLGLRTFRGVLGREQEVIVTPTAVRLTGLDSMPQGVEHVLRLQVVQETLKKALIHVVPTAGFREEDAQRLLANARAKAPADVEFSVEVVRWLERTPRGKTPLIVYRAPVHEALRRVGIEPVQTR
jgi:phenylacetate-CoA ligase